VRLIIAVLLTTFLSAIPDLSGTVRDPSGGPLPDVTVTVFGPTLRMPLATLTSEGGAYRLTGLPPGKYDVTFSLMCFRNAHRRDLSIAEGKGAVVDVVLRPVSGGACGEV
jgi:hypothetical protein